VSARESNLRRASDVGKSTRNGDQPSVGDATRALTLPQLPYGDAVYAELAAHGLAPEVLETGLRSKPGLPELYVRLCWTPGHPVLGDAVEPYGLTLAWSHVTGWSAHDCHGGHILLDLDVLAAPKAVKEAGEHLARHHLDDAWEPSDRTARWENALYLDIALVHFDEREGPL
jgi:hypothetical protein